jgi:hypothetical protein
MILKKKRVDWDKLLKICRDSCTERYLYLTLLLIRQLLGGDLPDEFLEKIKPDDFSEEIMLKAENILFREKVEGASDALMVGRTLAEGGLCLNSNFFHKLFPSKSEMSETYAVDPGTLKILLYYPVRWKDLFVKYIRVVCKIITGDKMLKGSLELGKEAGELAEWLKL